MDSLTQSFFSFVTQFSFSAYFIIFLIAFVESLAFLGLLVPGVVIIALMGYFSITGNVSMLWMFFYCFSGAIIGDTTSYILGTKNSRFLKGKLSKLLLGYIRKGEEFMEKHGVKSIFFGRFVGPMRPVIPYIAGFLKMNFRDFLTWDFSSSFVWSLAYLLMGYYGGKFWQNFNLVPKKIWWFVFYAALAVFIYYFLKWIARKYGKRIYHFVKSVIKSILIAVATNPDVQKLSDKYPKSSGFVKRRFSRKDFYGLFFTVLTVVFSYFFYLFYAVIRDVYHIDFLVGADIRIGNLLYSFRDPIGVSVFMVVTLIGKFYVISLLALIFSIYLWKRRKRAYIIPLWFSILGGELIVSIGKLIFQRPRPTDLSVYTEASFSFPSGHSALSMIFFGFVAYYFWKNLESNESKIKMLFFNLLTIFLVGLSRVYLGVHFFSDVWGGYLLGFMWLIIGVNISEWLIHKKKGLVASEKPFAKLALTSFLLIASQLGLFANYFIKYQDPLFGVAIIHAEPLYSGSNSPGGIFKDFSLNRYSETLSGKPMEPISFTIAAKSDAELVGIFKKAGWILADTVTPESLSRISKAAFMGESYPEAPMTPSFWNAQVHNFGFQKPIDINSIKERHHARFWKTSVKTKEGKNVYVGTASLDVGLKWGITHEISPDIDTEREYIMKELVGTGMISSWEKTKLVDPVLGKNISGDQFFTDGEMYVLILD